MGYLSVADTIELPDMVIDAMEAAEHAKNDEEFMSFISKDNPFYVEGVSDMNDGELLNVFGSLIFPTSGISFTDMILELILRSDLNDLTDETALTMYLMVIEAKKGIRTNKFSHFNAALDAMTSAFGGGPSGIRPRRED